MSDVFRQIYTPLTEQQKTATCDLKSKFQELHAFISDAAHDIPTTDQRMISIALTNLEQSAMWAVKGITTGPVQES